MCREAEVCVFCVKAGGCGALREPEWEACVREGQRGVVAPEGLDRGNWSLLVTGVAARRGSCRVEFLLDQRVAGFGRQALRDRTGGEEVGGVLRSLVFADDTERGVVFFQKVLIFLPRLLFSEELLVCFVDLLPLVVGDVVCLLLFRGQFVVLLCLLFLFRLFHFRREESLQLCVERRRRGRLVCGAMFKKGLTVVVSICVEPDCKFLCLVRGGGVGKDRGAGGLIDDGGRQSILWLSGCSGAEHGAAYHGFDSSALAHR